MRMIEIVALDNGAHRNQTYHGFLPNGWAKLPDSVETAIFPFGEPTVEEINGEMTVTAWTPGKMPDSEPILAPVPTQLDRVEAQMAYTAMMTNTLLEV